ncbi:AAA family ATPase [Sporosarcina sp. 179-K 8C2 HS]|uniref:AAA family ATPase n=1 Tax=Sporosarcina sp. 179-K 8C2 HS TaxID=3142387 RepID=UPI00399FD515
MSNIKKLSIHKFRGIKNEEIIIGKQLTAIMGQNGAQKSTILGMLAQPFNYSRTRNIIKQPFATKFSEIFNFSEDFDFAGEHKYTMEVFPNSALVKQLPNHSTTFNVNSRKRSGEFCLFTFDTTETEFNLNKDEFKGLINSYTSFKNYISKEKITNKKITKSHLDNELSLREVLTHFKNDEIEKIYYCSPPNDDIKKTNYIIELKPTSTHLRFVTGNTNRSGEGNLTLPVIYLGLSRVAPIGEIDRDLITLSNSVKMRDFEEEIAKKSRRILLDLESSEYQTTTLDIKDSPDNIRVGIHTEDYSPISMSAGQDNISKIISSIYSFQQLKQENEDDYIGGLLLIDELDATLYPGAQIELIRFMKTMSRKLDLQIIFTTHSIHIVEEMYSPENKDKFSINYLKRRSDGTLINKTDMTPETVYYDIAVKSKSKVPKIPCFCEDNFAANMLKALLFVSEDYSSDDFEYIDTQSSYNTLRKLIENQNKYMQHNIYVIDGDHPEIINNLNESNIQHTGVTLPLDAPEIVLSLFITEEIPIDHPIFEDYSYNKQQLASIYNQIQNPSSSEKSKIFIKQQIKSAKKIFRNDCEELFVLWAEWFKNNHTEKYNNFIKDFKKAHDLVLKNIRL